MAARPVGSRDPKGVMNMQRIRNNDQVMVMSGKDRGKSGKVIRVFPDERRVLVEKLNRVKRHQRPTAKMRQGGIVEKEAPIDMSKVMPLCPRCSKGVRIGIRMDGEGNKVRYCRKCKEALAA